MSYPNKTSIKNKHPSPAGSETRISSARPVTVPAGVAIILVAVFLCYLPSINGGFIWDDRGLLAESDLIKAPDGLYRFWCTTEPPDYWPVTNTTFWLEWRLWGMNPTGYHVTNLILHVVEALLIWVILRKLSIPGAFWAALFFAVHPVNVESVAWIAQRKNLMAMLFFLLSILCYLQTEIPSPLAPGRRASGRWSLWYWLSLAAFVLAMLSKGSVAVLPVLLLGIIWWLRPLTRWDLLRSAPFFAVALVLAGVNVWFQTHGEQVEPRAVDFAQRLLGAGGVVWFYLYKALLPVDLAFVYPQWRIHSGNLLWWLPLAAALFITAVLWLYRNGWSRPFLFAWGFFCATLLPVMGFTDVGFMQYSLVADHYQHIALVGLIALAAAGWSRWRQYMPGQTRWAAYVVAVMAAGSLAFLTWRQCGLYRDDVTLYQATLEKNPDSWILHNNLGFILAHTARHQDAVEHLQKSLQLNPNYHETYNNLGYLLLKEGRLPEAIEHLHRALWLKADYAEAHYNLGLALASADRLQEAITHYEQALRLKPNYAEAHSNLGVVLIRSARSQEAIEHFHQALAIKPDYVDVYNNLGSALAQTGRLQEAIENFKQALRFKPDSVDAYYNLALAYVQTNRPAEALSAAQKALDLARSQGHAALAKEIEDWLNSYRAKIGD